MRALKITVLTTAAALAMFTMLAAGSHAGTPARASSPQQVVTPGEPTFTEGAAHAAARLSADQAKAIATREFGPGLLSHPFTVRYGSFTDVRYKRSTPTGKQLVGTRDAWEVTVTGLNVPRPCPRFASLACPPVQTLTVVVDDKAGGFLEAIGT